MMLGITVFSANIIALRAQAQTTNPEMGPTGVDMIPTDLPARASSMPDGDQPVSLLPGTVPTDTVIEQEIEVPSLADQYQRTINGNPPIRPVRKQSSQKAITPVRSPAPPAKIMQPTAKVDGLPTSAPGGSTPVETAAPTGNGRHLIQLGAFRDTFTAETYWASFRIRYPELSKSHEKRIVPADLGSQGIYHRLQLVGFSDVEAAQKQCRQLKADGTDCFATHR
ncbi:SPOR domain-containing protein [Thalassospira sp. HF15]|uniref:SPOR domain-containing protein n=1 Tax=Thalassospira sp. HF15 TaxID=2722755 RepID=UPI001430F386|nr:SPOR domain-containing protein [Thalassospira sp. HF15]NIY74571.1 SPOR domain-containing protein [Thalassospira sp. HF15]